MWPWFKEEKAKPAPEATEERYKRRPVFQWSWPYWVGTVAVMTFLGALFLAAFISLAGGPDFVAVLGPALALVPFPVGCVLLWWWYRALQEEEQEIRTVPLPGLEAPEPPERDPIIFKPYAPKQLEAPNRFTPDVVVMLIKELWDRGKLSRRAVMGLRLPGGQSVSKGMWKRLIGGYEDGQGRQRPGLLAEAGLIVRTNSGSWAWRDGITLADVMGCFDWGASQIEAPKALEDLGRAGWAGRGVGNEGATCAERWLERNRGRLGLDE